ncbi:hypothetical protein HK098_001826 [Nowakowskiella sp. JEL0407]|nr:hypothetical protein HK098_001826 [Nowakowskiella sp. JEL0407]
MSASNNWWDQFPKPKAEPEKVPAEQVAALYTSPDEKPGETFLVVDVRKNDYGGGHVKDSVNAPAQDFYESREDFVEKYSHVPKVYFYCGYSAQRGPLTASWYQDALDEKGITTSKALVLEGGINGWVEKFKDDKNLVDEYDEEYWKNQKKH